MTILDEDFPGTLQFLCTECNVNKTAKKVEIVIQRSNGCDGPISCMIKTMALHADNALGTNAVEFDDYLPMHEKVQFDHGETEKVVKIQLMGDNETNVNGEKKGETIDHDTNSEKDDLPDLMFKVMLLNPQPEGVKISKKNICIVRISQKDEGSAEEESEKLLEYFLQVREPSWGQQFKNAVMLGPQVDSDNLIIDTVSLGEALFHFATIGWKFIFAMVPPPKWHGGYPAFAAALVFIGVLTAIVE